MEAWYPETDMRLLQKIAPPLILIAITLLVCEGLLRVVPSPVQYPPIREADDPNSIVGVELTPGARQLEQTSCSSWYESINRLGWRDKERMIERQPGKIRIAVLGDSFTEGAAVNDDETFTRQLEKLLGEDKVEVLNFGLSSIGTAQEEILYERVVAEYQPDVVLMAVYMNDLSNNHPVLEGGKGKETRLAYRDTEGKVVKYQTVDGSFGIRKWLRVHSAVFRLLKASDRIVRGLFNRESGSVAAEGFPSQYWVYGEPPTQDWVESWKITEDALLRMQAHMKSNQKFMFFVAPSVIEVAENPHELMKKEFNVDVPTSFDPSYLQNRLYSFADQHNIETIDIHAGFLKYIKEHSLSYPYFSRDCDGHWAALGHEVAAEILAAELEVLIKR